MPKNYEVSVEDTHTSKRVVSVKTPKGRGGDLNLIRENNGLVRVFDGSLLSAGQAQARVPVEALVEAVNAIKREF